MAGVTIVVKEEATESKSSELLGLPPSEWLPNRYRFVRDLSTGRSARVCSVLDTESDQVVAVKFVDLATLNESQRQRLESEVQIMRDFSHPGSVRLHTSFTTERYTLIVMDFVSGGDLLQYLWSKPDYRLSLDECSSIFAQTVVVLDELHRNGYVHRDIKPENILLEPNGQVKLADFGFACSWSKFQRRNSSVGTIYYAAPEIVTRGCSYNGPEVDVWSLGVTLFAMINGYLPFHGDNNSVTRRLIRLGVVPPYSVQPPDSVVALIRRMLDVEQRNRPTFEEILREPWVQSGLIVAEARKNSRTRSRSAGNSSEGLDSLKTDILRRDGSILKEEVGGPRTPRRPISRVMAWISQRMSSHSNQSSSDSVNRSDVIQKPAREKKTKNSTNKSLHTDSRLTPSK